jgi:hypothetical protein
MLENLKEREKMNSLALSLDAPGNKNQRTSDRQANGGVVKQAYTKEGEPIELIPIVYLSS